MRRARWITVATLLSLAAVACSGQPPREGASGTIPDPSQTGGLVNESPSTLPNGSAAPTPGVTATSGPSGGSAGTGGNTGSGSNGGTNNGGSGGGGGGGGGVPEANLYSGAEATQGITDDEIRLCGHAGLALASVFGNDIDQLERTYWRMVNESGGVHGRRVEFRFEDDGYSPTTTPNAFNACRDFDPFFMIGGIGFDQTPTFRGLAESNKELYIHGMATEATGVALKYSFAAAPSVEYLGKRFGEAVMSKLRGKKVGILTVSSAGWKGAADTFTSRIRSLGYTGDIVRREIANNNEVLTSHVQAFESAGVQVVYLNTNVLAWTRFVTEADGQTYYPHMVGFGFNLLTDTVGETMQKFPRSWGLSPWVVYDPQTTYNWSAEYERMKKAYRDYWGNNSPNDIDWIQWVSMKSFHRLLLDCGKTCNRNNIAGLLLAGYERTEFPNCRVDFGRGRIGGYLSNLWQSAPRGDTTYWKQVSTCKASF